MTLPSPVPTRHTFAVGRLDRSTSELRLVEASDAPPFPGPWSLKAVVRERRVTGPDLRIVR
jgi:hypothetical protein